METLPRLRVQHPPETWRRLTPLMKIALNSGHLSSSCQRRLLSSIVEIATRFRHALRQILILTYHPYSIPCNVDLSFWKAMVVTSPSFDVTIISSLSTNSQDSYPPRSTYLCFRHRPSECSPSFHTIDAQRHHHSFSSNTSGYGQLRKPCWPFWQLEWHVYVRNFQNGRLRSFDAGPAVYLKMSKLGRGRPHFLMKWTSTAICKFSIFF